jgi:hypothetical protein
MGFGVFFFALWVLWEVGVSSLVWRFYLFFCALGALGGWLRILHRCEEKLTVGFLSLFFFALWEVGCGYFIDARKS